MKYLKHLLGKEKADKIPLQEIKRGQGAVIEIKKKKTAVYKKEDGTLVKLSPQCTHLGCQLSWDKEQKGWSCPCHGSFFSPEGKVIKGPAKKDLEPKNERQWKVKVLMREFVTHNVQRFIVEKPEGFRYTPGQATYLALDRKGWRKEKRPFTFTSLNHDKVLEFIIKEYPEHNGVTQELHKIKSGQKIIMHQPFGTIKFKNRGVFLAGGAGVTPFIAIFRSLKQKNKVEGSKLIFSNRQQKDVILEKEFREMLGENLVLTLTEEQKKGYENRLIDKDFLKDYIQDFSQSFYICGPPGFERDIKKHLRELGAEPKSIVFEQGL